MPQLEFQFYATQIFWLVIVFTFIYCFMAWYFIPKVGNIVKNRQEKVAHYLSTAEFLISEQKALKIKVNKLLEEARLSAVEIKKAAFKASEAELHKFIAKTEKDLTKKTAKEEERLARYKIQLQHDVDQIIDSLTKEILAIILVKAKTTSRTN